MLQREDVLKVREAAQDAIREAQETILRAEGAIRAADHLLTLFDQPTTPEPDNDHQHGAESVP